MIVEKTKFKYSSCCLLAKHVGWRKYERIGSKHMEYANKQLCGQALKSDIISMAFQNDVLHKHSQDFGVITFFQLNHCFFCRGGGETMVSIVDICIQIIFKKQHVLKCT